MKRVFALLIGMMVWVAVARAADVKVKTVMTTGPEGEPVTTFDSDTPELYAISKTEGVKSGDKIRGVLIAEDVGKAAPPNTKVFETTLEMDADDEQGDFNFSKPTDGWPPGKYRVEVYVNDKLVDTVKFTIQAAKSEKGSKKSEG